MADKKVSVRLVAEGGQRVKAELAGIAGAANREFEKLDKTAALASARMASFARYAGMALGAVAVAAAATGVAMVKMTLDVVDAQVNLARSFDTTTRSMQNLALAADYSGVEMAQVESAARKLTFGLAEAARGSGKAQDALRRLHMSVEELQDMPLDERVAAINTALVRYIPEAERAAVASDLFGSKVALLMTRLDAETIAAATKDVEDFGLALTEAQAGAIEEAGDALARFGLSAQGAATQLTAVLAPSITNIANIMSAMWLEPGEALGALVDLYFQAFGKIGAYSHAAAADIAAAMAEGAVPLYEWADEAVRVFEGAYKAAVAIWGALPGAIGDYAYRAANSLIDGVESMLNAVVERINKFITMLNAGLAKLPGGVALDTMGTFSLGDVDNPYAGGADAAAGAALDAFNSAQGLGLGGVAEETASAWRRTADILWEAAAKPLPAWEQLKAILGGAGDATAELNDELEENAGAGDGGGKAGKAAKGAKEVAEGWAAATQSMAEYIKESKDVPKQIGGGIVNAFSSAEAAMSSFVEKGKLDMKSLATSIIADFARIGAKAYLFGPLMEIFGHAMTKIGLPISLPSADGGGFTGNAARAGGMDGKGGFLAMLHPQETVIDHTRGQRAPGMAPVVVNIQTRDAQSFRASRAQIAADLQRAVAYGSRAR